MESRKLFLDEDKPVGLLLKFDPQPLDLRVPLFPTVTVDGDAEEAGDVDVVVDAELFDEGGEDALRERLEDLGMDRHCGGQGKSEAGWREGRAGTYCRRSR